MVGGGGGGGAEAGGDGGGLWKRVGKRQIAECKKHLGCVVMSLCFQRLGNALTSVSDMRRQHISSSRRGALS